MEGQGAARPRVYGMTWLRIPYKYAGLFILLSINSHFVSRYQYGVPLEGEKGTWAGQGRAGRGERLSRKEGKVEVTGESLSVVVVVVP